jgi:hypothetical protein
VVSARGFVGRGEDAKTAGEQTANRNASVRYEQAGVESFALPIWAWLLRESNRRALLAGYRAVCM